jgi:hypothetical protein
MNPIKMAADNLKGHWHKGSSADGTCHYCGIGHLDNALAQLNINSGVSDLYNLLTEVAREQYPERTLEGDYHMKMYGGTFPDFNDHPATTEDEVIAVMEKAAVRLEEIV